jgi:hypothetical protein
MKQYDKDSKIQCPFCWKECSLSGTSIETISYDSDTFGKITRPYRRVVRFVCDFCDTTIVHVDKM